MACGGTISMSFSVSVAIRMVAVMPGRRRLSNSSSATLTSKLRGGGHDVKSALASALMVAMWPFSSLSGSASTRTVAAWFSDRRPRSISSTRADPNIDEESGSSAMLAPAHTRSPSLKSCGFIQLPDRQLRRMATVPSAGAVTLSAFS